MFNLDIQTGHGTSRSLSPFCIQQVAWYYMVEGIYMQVVSYLQKLKLQNFNYTYQTNHNLTLRTSKRQYIGALTIHA